MDVFAIIVIVIPACLLLFWGCWSELKVRCRREEGDKGETRLLADKTCLCLDDSEMGWDQNVGLITLET